MNAYRELGYIILGPSNFSCTLIFLVLKQHHFNVWHVNKVSNNSSSLQIKTFKVKG